MGLLKRIFGKREPERPVTIDLEDAEILVAKKLETWDKKTLSPLVREILEHRDSAISIVEDLRDYEFPEEIKDRVFKPALTAKPKYVKGLLESLRGIKEKELDYEGLVEFHKEILKALKTVQKVQFSHGKYIAAVYADHVPKLGTHLNRIIDLSEDLGEKLEEERNRREELKKLESNVRELRKKIAEKREAEDRRKNIAEEVSRLEKEIENIAGEKSRIELSGKYREIAGLEDELRSVGQEISEIRSRVLNILGPLTRVFRKYKKLVEDNKIRGDLESVEKYISQPAEAFFSEGKDFPSLRGIIIGCREAATSGLLSLDKKEKKRIQGLEGTLCGIKEDFLGLKEKEKLLQRRLTSNSIKNRIAELDLEIRRKKEVLNNLASRLSAVDAEETKIDEEISRLKKEIEEGIARMEGKEVKVEIY
jgi:chromosome segregation ATPase